MGVARCANGVRSGAAQPTGADVINYAGKQTANVGEPPTLHFWVFRLPLVGGKFVGRAFMPDKHKPVYLYRYTTIKNVGHKCPTYLGLVFRLPLLDKQRQPENHILRATIGVKPAPRYLSPIAIKLALPPAAVVFTLHEIS